MQIKQIYPIALLFLVLFFLFPIKIKAQNITAGDIIITEIMPDPEAVFDSDGEWFEIYNTSNHDINLKDCNFSDNGSNTFNIDDVLTILPKNYLVLGKNKDQSSNGGVKIDFQYSSFTLANTDDEIIITCNNQEINRVEYDKNKGWQITAGKSMMLANLDSDNNSATNWCLSAPAYGKGDKGTPGKDNGECANDDDNTNPPKIDPGNKPPYPEMIFPQQGYVGQILSFDGSNSYDPDGDKITYTWQFGDNTIVKQKTTTHIYKKPGVYQIKLTVSDGVNNRTSYQTIFIYNDQMSKLKGKIIINELFANPEGEDDEEWIELKNISQDDINLKNLIIRDKRTSYQIETDKKLKPNDFFIILKYDSHISLNNTTPETVNLLTPSQQLIDSVSYEGNVKTNFSYARLGNEWQWTNMPTAGKENKISNNNTTEKNQNPITEINKTKVIEKNICPENYQAKIIINELWPSPDGDDSLLEFIELKNLDDQDVNICNWTINDKNHKYKIPDQKIPADGFLIINRSNSHISLNNSGDTITLLNPKGDIVDDISYSKAKNNLSWARDNNNNWHWTTIVTPHEENIISNNITNISKKINNKPSKNNYLPTNLKKIESLESGQKITTSGIITVKPGILDEKIMYITDSGSGLQIYNYKKQWPELKTGDKITIKGELSYPYGLPRLKIKSANDITIIKIKNKEKNKIYFSEIKNLSEKNLNTLIAVNGEIIEKNKNSFFLDDQTGELEIVIKPSTSIKLDNLSEGDIIKVAGIFSKGRNNFQLLPRNNNDITKIKVKGWETTNKQNQQIKEQFNNQKFITITNYIYITLIGIIFALLGLIYKLKIKKYGREKSR